MQRKESKFGLRAKILLTIFASTVITLVVVMACTIPGFKRTIASNVQNNIYNMAVSYGQLIDEKLNQNNGVLTTEQYDSFLKGISVNGYPSSYAYLVNSEGTMMYHPTTSKIGNAVENSVVTGLVAQIGNGIYAEPAFIEYDFKGVTKYAAYYISGIDHSILVITMDEEEAYTGLSSIYIRILVGFLAVTVVTLSFGVWIAAIMSRPFRNVAGVADRIAKLDLSHDEVHEKLAKRNDEAGLIAKSMMLMRNNLADVVENISNAADVLSRGAEELNTVTQSVNEFSSDNSATSEELAAGMQETTATTESISSNVTHISDKTKSINDIASDGSKMATDITERAKALRDSSQAANDKTQAMYKQVKDKTTAAIEQSKSVDKIQTLSDSIMAIASQTSLLSLNASIEAARAGEAGRGFAVVAGEIGNLASQSTETVNGILGIVAEVKTAVDNMAACLTQTLEFLENNVTTDYSHFIEVGNQYNEDAKSIDELMDVIDSAASELQNSVSEIATAISGINSTISESASGIADIADKTSQTVALTAKTADMVNENLQNADILKKTVGKFTL